MSADMYPRPSREEIAARVHGAVAEVRSHSEGSDVLAWFSAHYRAALAVRGWSLADLAERTGDPTGNLSQALNGSKCPMAMAGRIAAGFGMTLAEMVVPYACRTCAGEPPQGFACLECGTEARGSS